MISMDEIVKSNPKSSNRIVESDDEKEIKINDKIPADEALFFQRIAWRKRENQEEKKTMSRINQPKGSTNTPRSQKYIARSMTKLKSEKLNENFERSFLGIDFSRFEKGPVPGPQIVNVDQRHLNVASFFLMLGRIFSYTKKIKEKLFLAQTKNLKQLQIKLLNDKAFVTDEDKDILARKSLFYYRKNTQKILTIFKLLQELASGIFLHIKVFHPLNRILILWKTFLCLFILFESFSVTIFLFFNQNWDRDYESIKSLKEMLKLVMAADILVVCNTGIFISGAVFYNRRDAFRKYLKGNFLIDLIAFASLLLPTFEDSNKNDSFPIPALIVSPYNIYKVFFLLKLKQIKIVNKNLEEILITDDFYEGLLCLVNLITKVLMISHIIACGWNFAASFEKFKGNESWLDKFAGSDVNPTSWSQYYLYSWYWSLATMITVGYGDISPKNDKEVAVASLAMLFGCGFFAYAINSIGIIVERFSVREKNLKKVLRVINKYMRRYAVDFNIQIKVRKYLEHLWLREEIEDRELEDQILSSLSKTLREQLLIHSQGKILARCDLLTTYFSEEVLERASQKLNTVSFAPDDLIVYEGEHSNNMIYFIVKGEVEGFHYNTRNGSTVLRTMKEGEYFGQMSFFTEAERNINMRSVGFSTLYTLNREDFLEILAEFPMDFEKFHFLKDKIQIYEEVAKIGLKCDLCGNPHHNIQNCPSLKYIPNKHLILRRYLVDEGNVRRKYKRKNKLKSESALLLIQLFNKNSSSYSLGEEFEEESTKNEKKTLEIIPEIEELEKKNIFILKTDSSPPIDEHFEKNNEDIFNRTISKADKNRKLMSWRSGLNQESSYEDLNPKKVIKPSLIPGISIYSEATGEASDQATTGTSNEARFERRKRSQMPQRGSIIRHFLERPEKSTEFKRIHTSNTMVTQANSTSIDNVQSGIFGGLNIDRLHCYSIYFPYNNSNIVIDFINKKQPPLNKSLTRLKTKVITNSALANNSNGLIEFRNQIIHFMKHKEKKQTKGSHSPSKSLKRDVPSVFRKGSKHAFTTFGRLAE